MHVVRSGDTLWDLARFYLDDPFLWPEIYRINTMVIEDPHWIYPGEQLGLPFPGEIARRPPPAPVDTAPTPPPQVTGEPTSIFAQRETRTRTTLVYQPTAPVPPTAVTEGDFLRSGMLLPLDELGPRGRVVDYIAPTVVELELPATVPKFGRIYVSHPNDIAPEPGDRLLIFRVERRVGSFGRIIRPTGFATVAAIHEEVSTAVVTDLFARLRIDDQVMIIQPDNTPPGIFAEPVETGPTGELIAQLDVQPVPSVDDILFIDVGRNQGVSIGDEFEIYLPPRRAKTGHALPDEHVAVGRVVRVTESTATLRILEQRHAAIEVGLPVRLVRRMPS